MGGKESRSEKKIVSPLPSLFFLPHPQDRRYFKQQEIILWRKAQSLTIGHNADATKKL